MSPTPDITNRSSCVTCKRGIAKRHRETHFRFLTPPDWCQWCGRAVSGDAKMLEESVAKARQMDTLQACRILAG